MTKEEQRIAIAEACGWSWQELELGFACWHRPNGSFVNKSLFAETRTKENQIESLPDYLNDLNAMHEAEKQNIVDLFQAYPSWVHYLEQVSPKSGTSPEWATFFIRLSAAKRAEAFLKTLNLWKDL